MTRSTGDVTRVVTEIWESVLGVDDIAGEENFLDLGGDSMTATEIAARVRERLGVDVALRTIFDHPTVDELAAALRGRRS
jgi:acyl carrier protein